MLYIPCVEFKFCVHYIQSSLEKKKRLTNFQMRLSGQVQRSRRQNYSSWSWLKVEVLTRSPASFQAEKKKSGLAKTPVFSTLNWFRSVITQ